MNTRPAKVSYIASRMALKNFTQGIDLETKEIAVPDVNLPALQLHGFYESFQPNRVQILGNVEKAYIASKTPEQQIELFDKLFSTGIPCLIACNGYEPPAEVVAHAENMGVPFLGTERQTSEFMSEFIWILSHALAPMTTIHGVLVDVYGEGLLITGESGIGKSEAALELIKRGHRLVADDVVEIRRTNAATLRGSAPAVTKHLIELRGIGVIDVKSLFGVECVKDEQRIDFVIQLEDWKKEATYDRLGMTDNYMDILGVDVVCHNLPIRPGRNLAIICETAAVNHRQKKMGYNAAEELYRRVQANMGSGEK